ncbi:MAG TPA: hypothetical protein VHD32_11415 [Candidatus Didemnitutus sp.]|nr:hypothetical protein [Candidatus Didemnitutus sp.]
MTRPSTSLSLDTLNWIVGAPILQTTLLVLCLRWCRNLNIQPAFARLAIASSWGAIASRYGYWGPEMAWSCGVFVHCYQKYSPANPRVGAVLTVISHSTMNLIAFATTGWSEPLIPFQPL